MVVKASPFLRWAGGKSKIVAHLLQHIPPSYNHYWEPFLGAGALFFALSPTSATLSDLNQDLIDCYQWVSRRPQLIWRYLQRHAKFSSEAYYYSVRIKFNKGGSSAAQAARFIYLNKTSFNGIYRVNLKGEFNVPYGRKEPPSLPSLEDLVHASEILNGTRLVASSFFTTRIKDGPQQDDFVYLDPPYPPLNGTSYFRHYTTNRFSWDDQVTVAKVADAIRTRGCHVMISNADLPQIRSLYNSWHCHTLPVVRWIAANGSRVKARELVITSFAPSFNDQIASPITRGAT